MDLPFMLLFARNSVPDDNHTFHFATPIRESRVSSRGNFRLDYQSAQTVSAAEVAAKPWLLKVIAVGTVLDADIIERLVAKGMEVPGEGMERSLAFLRRWLSCSARIWTKTCRRALRSS
jgi:hypothetical protein